MNDKSKNFTIEGEAQYKAYRERLMADPEVATIYAAEACKKELWLQLVEARQNAKLTQAEMAKRLGVSQAQVARIEKRGYDAYTLNTLRKYVEALGTGYAIEIRIHKPRTAQRRLASQPVVSL